MDFRKIQLTVARILQRGVGGQNAAATDIEQTLLAHQPVDSLTQFIASLPLSRQSLREEFARGVAAYYDHLIGTLGADRVAALKPTKHVPNCGRALLDHTRGIQASAIYGSAKASVRRIEEVWQSTTDSSNKTLFALLRGAEYWMDVAVLLDDREKVFNLRGLSYALLRELEQCASPNLFADASTICALKDALRTSTLFRPHTGFDLADLARWYRESAERGDLTAQRAIACLYYNGEGVPKDNAQALAWLRKVAESGDADSECFLGQAYNDIGEPSEAVGWYRKAAEKGNSEAQFRLGLLYATGNGVPKDSAEAVTWWRKAAEQGNACVLYNLGLMYWDGNGVPTDHAQAAALFRAAAEQGYPAAQYNLGVIHAEGDAVPKDPVAAYMWCSLAAAQGDAEAEINRDRIKSTMSEAQIAEAQDLIRGWTPKVRTSSPL